MFYDLEEPLKFMNEINQSLSDDGIWVFEQSYLPFMIKTISLIQFVMNILNITLCIK